MVFGWSGPVRFVPTYLRCRCCATERMELTQMEGRGTKPEKQINEYVRKANTIDINQRFMLILIAFRCVWSPPPPPAVHCKIAENLEADMSESFMNFHYYFYFLFSVFYRRIKTLSVWHSMKASRTTILFVHSFVLFALSLCETEGNGTRTKCDSKWVRHDTTECDRRGNGMENEMKKRMKEKKNTGTQPMRRARMSHAHRARQPEEKKLTVINWHEMGRKSKIAFKHLRARCDVLGARDTLNRSHY